MNLKLCASSFSHTLVMLTPLIHSGVCYSPHRVTTTTALLTIADEPQTVSKHLMASEYEKKNDTHSVRFIWKVGSVIV